MPSIPGPAIVVVFATIVAATAPTATAGDGAAFTLTELVHSAVASHEDVARASSEVRRAEADIKLSQSILLPRLDLNGTYTRYGKEISLDLGDGESFSILPRNDWNWSADLTQTLFSGLRDWRARDVARLRRDIARIERRTTEVNLVLEVAQGFFDTVTADQRQGVRRTAHEHIQAQLRVAERRYEVGEATTGDVARWRSRVAAARQDLVIAEGEAELARRRLARLAGVDRVGELEPPGAIPIPEGDTAHLLVQALDRRLEMAALDHQLAAAGLMIQVERGAWWPSLDAHLQYYQQQADFPAPSWGSLALTLKVPVYDGGLTSARVAQAREDLRQIGLLKSEIEKGIADQVDVAVLTYRTASAAYDAAVERTAAATEAHRQMVRAYSAGEASSTDLLTTTTDLTEAETARVIARWTRELNAIALRHAVGLDPLPDLHHPLTGEDS